MKKQDCPPIEKPTQGTSVPSGPVTPILMPQVGNTMEEGTVLKWLVKSGDCIQKGEIIFEVETDKAVVDVEATDSGRVARIVVGEDEMIKVLQPVAYLAERDADVDVYLASRQKSTPRPPLLPSEAHSIAAEVPTPSATPSGGDRKIKASPSARRLARERGIDLLTVGTGTGPEGRILSTDLEEAAAVPPSAEVAGGTPEQQGAVVRRPLDKMRRSIARNLQKSKQTIPHFYMRLTVDAKPLVNFHRTEKEKYPCSLNDIIIMACARGIQKFAAFRSRIEKDEIVEFPSANIGMAVGLENGLVVPVLIGVDRMSLRQIATETRRIVEAAREGKVEGMGQGVFTVSNLGMFGIEEFSAIINPPEAAVLAVGAIREQGIVTHGVLRPGQVMTMTLSADHRIIDGVLAARFLAQLKDLLEEPARLG